MSVHDHSTAFGRGWVPAARDIGLPDDRDGAGPVCPVLTPDLIRQVADALDRHDAVLVPAEDGGYVLIALRRADPRLFEAIDWSTDRVMAQTRLRLRALGLDWHETAPLWDVDRPADFERLAARFPALRSVLASSGQA